MVSDQLRHSRKEFKINPFTIVKQGRQSKNKFYIRTCVFRRWSRRMIATKILCLLGWDCNYSAKPPLCGYFVCLFKYCLFVCVAGGAHLCVGAEAKRLASCVFLCNPLPVLLSHDLSLNLRLMFSGLHWEPESPSRPHLLCPV